MRHILTIPDLPDDAFDEIFESADFFLDQINEGRKHFNDLQGRTLINLFLENSTRTRVSFEIAGQRLGMDVVNFDTATSSLAKDESVRDTLMTLDAMQADALVIRSGEEGLPARAATWVKAAVLNGGDGTQNHPTQALYDAFTLRRVKGRIEGLKVAICGDIKHSRVANSNAQLLTRLGAEVHFVGPRPLLPENSSVSCHESLEDGIRDADAVMMLRIQKERIAAALPFSPAEYFSQWGLTLNHLARAAKDVMVMHPGPMNRGIEIADDLADDPHHSYILRQVSNGVAVRMACLKWVLS